MKQIRFEAKFISFQLLILFVLLGILCIDHVSSHSRYPEFQQSDHYTQHSLNSEQTEQTLNSDHRHQTQHSEYSQNPHSQYLIYVQTIKNTFHLISNDEQVDYTWNKDPHSPIVSTIVHNHTMGAHFVASASGEMYMYENKESSVGGVNHRYSTSPFNLVDWIRYGKPWSKNGFYYQSSMNASYITLENSKRFMETQDHSYSVSKYTESDIYGESTMKNEPQILEYPSLSTFGTTLHSHDQQLNLYHIHYTLYSLFGHKPQYSIQYHDYFVLHNEDQEWEPGLDDTYQDFRATLSNQLYITRRIPTTNGSNSKYHQEQIIYQFDSLPVNVYIYLPKYRAYFKKRLDVSVEEMMLRNLDANDRAIYVQKLDPDQPAMEESSAHSLALTTTINNEYLTSYVEKLYALEIRKDAKLLAPPLSKSNSVEVRLLPQTKNHSEREVRALLSKFGIQVLKKFRNFDSLPTFDRLPLIPMKRDSNEINSNYIRAISYIEEDTEEDLVKDLSDGYLSYNRFWGVTVIILILGGTFLVYSFQKKALQDFREKTQTELNNLREVQSKLQEEKKILKHKINTTIKKNLKETEDEKWIGNLLVYKKKIIGHGSNGTIVFEGEFSHRKVAIKRMLKEFHTHVQNEISLLIESDEHAHVVRYYAKEEDDQFIYLALELCTFTLDEAVEKIFNSKSCMLQLNQKTVLREIVAAVHHLHSLNIVHRDIKPQNILLDGNNRVKLSDMGLGKRIDRERSSFSMGGIQKIAGSVGWHAPEIFQLKHDNPEDKNLRLTKKVDIFSLGCVMYYVLTGGKHPFGEPIHREVNIMEGKYSLKHMKDTYPPYVRKLIKGMINPNPSARYSIEEVMKHPYFWDDAQKISFLCDVSDQLGKEKEGSKVYQNLEAKWKTITGIDSDKGWEIKLNSTIIEGVTKFRKYNYRKVWDLLRLIRNIRAHYREYDSSVKEVLAPYPEGIYQHFSNIFPNLFSIVYDEASYWKDLESFARYY